MELLTWGGERAHAGPWSGMAWGDGDRIAHLTPLGDASRRGVNSILAPSPTFLRRCLATLADRGYTAVVTPPLTTAEIPSFAAVGFETHERLILLKHDLRRLAPKAAIRVQDAKPHQHQLVLDLDAAAFEPSWRLDHAGLVDAIGATSVARLRLAPGPGRGDRHGLLGYAVAGRTDTTGYLQRLAVHPLHRRASIGSALVCDALRWMRWRGARSALVNTQPANRGALGLYLSLGFEPQSSGLWVLRFDLRR